MWISREIIIVISLSKFNLNKIKNCSSKNLHLFVNFQKIKLSISLYIISKWYFLSDIILIKIIDVDGMLATGVRTLNF